MLYEHRLVYHRRHTLGLIEVNSQQLINQEMIVLNLSLGNRID